MFRINHFKKWQTLMMQQQYLLNELQRELDKLTNQSRFIMMIIDGKLVVSRRKKKDLVSELKKLNFKPFPKVADARKEGEFEAVVENDENDDSDANDAQTEAGANDYDYLLGMAIWSLTQERVDKLRRQIGDKETEIDVLIKLTPKDIWTQDLDDFIREWYLQLDDERKRTKKYQSMGRRASAKLGIEGKAGKRKKNIDDDSDFEVVKKKPKAKQGSNLADYFSKYDKPSEVVDTSAKATKPALKKSMSQDVDGAWDVVDDEPPRPKKGAATALKAKAPAGRPKKVEKPVVPVLSDDDDEDEFLAIANEEAKKPAASALPARAARNATKKPVKYDLDSDEDDDSEGNDMLGDVSTMVRGIGNSQSDTTAGRALFSASAQRPTSSNGLAARAKERLSTAHKLLDDSDTEMEDKTDYANLVPQDSPRRPAARTANETILTDDDNDSLDLAISKPKSKPVARTIKPAAKSATAKLAAKKIAAKAADAPPPKKPMTLSPAAKLYAARQLKAAASKATEHEDETLDALLDDEDSPAPVPAEAAPAAKRPGRAAAAKKSKYVLDESEDETEDDYDDEDDSD